MVTAAVMAPGPPPELGSAMQQRKERRQSNNSSSMDSSYLLVVVAETLEKPQKLYLQGDVLKYMCTLMLKP